MPPSTRIDRYRAIFGSTLLAIGLLSAADPMARPQTSATTEGATMQHASGSFIIKLEPQKDAASDPKLARMTIDKRFSGDLEATSVGQMLSAMTEVKGSAGYVAIEKVTGKLGGRTGSFVLQHSGTMDRGTPSLSVTVVPDSGTGDLTGITGSMTIENAGGQHSYAFDYTLP